MAFHDAVQSAPAGVGSEVGGAEAAAGPEDAASAAEGDASAVAKADVASNGRSVRSFIVWWVFSVENPSWVRAIGLHSELNSNFDLCFKSLAVQYTN